MINNMARLDTLLKDFSPNGATFNDQILRDSAVAVAETFENIDFESVLVGGKAAEILYYHSGHSRGSDDMDFILAPFMRKSEFSELVSKPIIEKLDDRYNITTSKKRFRYGIKVNSDDEQGIDLNFLTKSKGYLSDTSDTNQTWREIRNARMIQIPHTNTQIKTYRPEDIIAWKLYNYDQPRAKDWYDIKLVLDIYHDKIDRTYLRTAIIDQINYQINHKEKRDHSISPSFEAQLIINKLMRPIKSR